MPKKEEEELDLPDEAKEAIIHAVMVQLKKIADRVEMSATELYDRMGGAPAPETIDDTSTVITLWIDSKTYSCRVPSMVAHVADTIAARLGISRSRFIYDSLWDYAFPYWLKLLSAKSDELKGSIRVFHQNVDERIRETEYAMKAEQSIEGLMRVVEGYATSGDPPTWRKASIQLQTLLDNINSVKDGYWRRRLYAELLKNDRRLTTIVEVLRLNEVVGHQELTAGLKQAQEEAAS